MLRELWAIVCINYLKFELLSASSIPLLYLLLDLTGRIGWLCWVWVTLVIVNLAHFRGGTVSYPNRIRRGYQTPRTCQNAGIIYYGVMYDYLGKPCPWVGSLLWEVVSFCGCIWAHRRLAGPLSPAPSADAGDFSLVSVLLMWLFIVYGRRWVLLLVCNC